MTKAANNQAIVLRVRVVELKRRLRVQDQESGLFVSCPNEWRESMQPGRVYEMVAHLRADGACYVACKFNDYLPQLAA